MKKTPQNPTSEKQAVQIELSLLSYDCYDLLKAGKFDDAEAIAKKMIKSYPEDSTGHRYLSRVLRYAGRPQEAIEPAMRAVELEQGNPTNYDVLVKSLYAAGHTRQAVSTAFEGLKTLPKDRPLQSLKERLAETDDSDERGHIIDEDLAEKGEMFLLWLAEGDIDGNKSKKD